MSIITHAQAEQRKLTQEEIDRIFLGESKLPGKILQCYQSGKEIIHEIGLKDFEEKDRRIKAIRLDGSVFEMQSFNGDETVCTVITRKPAE